MRDDAEPVLRVLCVDDNRDTADSIAALLEIAGFEARACYDGPTALAVATKFLPEACVLDLNMPLMPGDELGQRIRRSACGLGTLLVALTGLPEDEARRRASDAGFDLFLTKPVDPDRLANVLIDIAILRAPLTSHPSAQIASPEPRTPPSE
jgi:CheY-like chemotaxis protein